jgi:hypothetical protein
MMHEFASTSTLTGLYGLSIDRQTPATEEKMPDCDDIIKGVRTKLQLAAQKGAAANSEVEAAWVKRVLGSGQLDNSVAIAILDQAGKDLNNEMFRLTHWAQLAKKPKEVSERKAELSDLRSWVQSEPLLGNLDENPFTPTKFRATISTTVEALLKILQ